MTFPPLDQVRQDVTVPQVETMVEQPPVLPSIQLGILDAKRAQQQPFSKTSLNQNGHSDLELECDRSQSPNDNVLKLQKWNEPRGNVVRFAAAFYSMFVFGLSDAAAGAILNYVS